MTNWKNDYKHIKVDELTLDLKNPRTDSGAVLTEQDVIKELLDENVMELAEDIIQNGYAPVSVFMVVVEDGKNVVVDGNRRLMALKLINDPEIVSGGASAGDLAKARELHALHEEDLSTATSILYPDRTTAERDMAKLHLAGIAIQQWRLIRQYRYFQKRIRDENLSIETVAELLALDNAAVKKGVKTYQLYEIARGRLSDISEDIGKDIFTDKNFRTDKFQRAVVNTEGERFLGYSFSDTSQSVEVLNEALFLERLRLVLLEIYDSSSKFIASAQFTAGDRLNFFRYIDPSYISEAEHKKAEKARGKTIASGQTDMFEKKDATSDKEGTLEPTPGTVVQAPAPVSPTPPDTSTTDKGTRPKPDWVVDADVRYYVGADRVKDILTELKKNSPLRGQNLNIVVTSLRIVVELAIYNKLSDKGAIATMIAGEKARIQAQNAQRAKDGKSLMILKKNWTPSLKEMLSYMLDEANHLITDPQERKSLDRVIQTCGDFVDDLDNFVHNVSYHPTEAIAKDIWKAFARPIFDILKKM